MRGAIRRSAAACIVVAAIGCAGDANRPTAEIVDSAGTRIVTYDLSNVIVPTYRILLGHDLEIGEQDGAPEYTFSRIADLAVANGGSLIQPRIVRRLDSPYASQRFAVEVRRQIMPPSIAAKLTTILTQAVAYGTGKNAALEGYTVAGKTGTAQKVDPEHGGYSRRLVLASFVGYVPAHAPQLVMLVMVDEPQILRWGGQAAAPVFRRIARQVLPYLQIPSLQGQILHLGVSVDHRLAQQRGVENVQASTLADVAGVGGKRLARIQE